LGEFSTLSPAKELQNTLIQNDYPQTIVVAFKNNVRSLDPALLKDQTVTEQRAAAEKTVKSEPVAQVKPAETKVETIKKEIPAPVTKQVETVKKEIPRPETKKPETVKTEPAKTEPVKPAIAEPATQKVIIAYRVQISSSSTKKGSYKITINNKNYNTFEYFYSGVYRTCVGDYSTLTSAKELQNICRKSGYPQAFVVAFKNNVRSIDPALFK
jgi:outer membrane biosynthesis protein TonB